MSELPPELVFASPRKLPRAADLRGRVVVLDLAFAADGMGGPGFAKITGRFLKELGPRLARWVDHHDHDLHAQYRGDDRFVLHTKAEHGACPEIITPELVAQTGPIDTIVAHFDLDGLYAAAKWILGGREPYPGADADARAVDTRVGIPPPSSSSVTKLSPLSKPAAMLTVVPSTTIATLARRCPSSSSSVLSKGRGWLGRCSRAMSSSTV